jgi:hypothetical protein
MPRREAYCVALLSLIGCILPMSMRALSFMYLVVCYPFAMIAPFVLLLSSNAKGRAVHFVPLALTVAASVVTGMWLYGGEAASGRPTAYLMSLGGIPTLLFVVSYLFFWRTLPLRYRQSDGNLREPRLDGGPPDAVS